MTKTDGYLVVLLAMYCCLSPLLVAQNSIATQISNEARQDAHLHHKMLEEELAPFYHGIASGDPLPDGVILWTRVTPEGQNPDENIVVTWEMATDKDLNNVVQSGETTTDLAKDYTVKVDVSGLEPATTYYYGFTALGMNSLTGRTRTAPEGDSEQLKFAVVSCSNYQHGYFNAYARIAERNDLDAVIHLGDYIYEYGSNVFASDSLDRGHEPETEILSLGDYRTRHSFYKLDPDLRAIHQQHPFIVTWDDHEIANNAWTEGAQNHTDATEGDYQERRNVARQVYFEWMPIRDTEAQRVYRKLSYGNLLDLVMIDTRHEGRNEQVDDLTSAEYADTNRTILGETQYEWLTNELENSTAQWKIIGNQVIFAPLLLEAITAVSPLAEAIIYDVWEGYPYERNRLLEFIDEQDIDNVAVLTGDIHTTFAFDMPLYPDDTAAYNPETGEGSIAVELIVTSVTSDGINEVVGDANAELFTTLALALNPHLKKVNLFDHGYFVLDVTPEQLQADWYVIDQRHEPSDVEMYDNGVITLSGANHLTTTETPALPKPIQAEPAPDFPPVVGISKNKPIEHQALTVLSIRPNPADEHCTLNYALNQSGQVNIHLYDVNQKVVGSLVEAGQTIGLYQLDFEVTHLPSGIYFLQFEFEGQKIVRQLVVK
ncbi:MAG: alkaline phosphatase D family protein [Chitinophagales bacterium]